MFWTEKGTGISVLAMTVALGCLFFLSCTRDHQLYDVRAVHPNRSLLESSRASVPVIDFRFPGTNSETSDAIGYLVEEFPEDHSIGVFQNPSEEVLGEIAEAALTADGRYVLLDVNYGALRIVDGDGRILQSLGSFGDGPGEFLDPVAVAVGSGDTLLVADASFRIHRFVPNLEGWAFLDQIKLDFSPEDICSARGRMFAIGTRLVETEEGHSLSGLEAVHEVDPSGQVTRSFGISYHSESVFVAQVFSSGRVACSDQNPRLWVAFATLGEVHAFSLSGEPLWIARLTDFEYPDVEERYSGGVGPDPRSVNRIDLISHVSLLSSDVLAVAIESKMIEDIERLDHSVSRRVYYLDPESGEGLGGLLGYGVIGGARGVGVAYREDPVPEVGLMFPRREER